MVSENGKLANAMGGKTARACDNCISKRAHWYCPTDDAFLCQVCDSSVHSANPLARRHDRVRLKTASLKPSKELSLEIPPPTWHHGFTKKARTPRGGKSGKSRFKEPERNHLHLVPEICCDETETSHEENEDQLLYRVPIFDPLVAELCTTANSNNEGAAANSGMNDESLCGNEPKAFDGGNDLNHQFHGSLPSEMELAEFAADVESLLGKGLDEELFDMEGLGFSDMGNGGRTVKVEDVQGGGEKEKVFKVDHHQKIDAEIDMMSRDQPFELSFDYGSPQATYEEEDSKGDVERSIGIKEDGDGDDDDDDHEMSIDCKAVVDDCSGMSIIGSSKGKILLNLDYEAVISAWSDQRSPWTTGERPELDSLGCWPDCMGTCGPIHHMNPYGEVGIFGHPASISDGGREARVSRYREKRRTRLFAKKIRYEVRKLNAEKRPRMKGRFVKRANFPANAFPMHSK